MATGEDKGTQDKLAELQRRRDEALHSGDERAVERQRSRGKLLARERIEKLLDPGQLRRARPLRPPSQPALRDDGSPPVGRRRRHRLRHDRRPTVFVFSQDFTVFGGSLSEAFAEKICKVMDLALKNGCPLIGINDSGGARIQEGVVSLGGYGEIFWRNVQASGVGAPDQRRHGPCAGGAVYSPAITDFIFMVEETSQMYITGPEVVKTVTGEDVTLEELGGAATHASKSGVAHFAADDEDACSRTRAACSRSCPQNNLEPPPYFEPTDPIEREDAELDASSPTSPNKPYDMRES